MSNEQTKSKAPPDIKAARHLALLVATGDVSSGRAWDNLALSFIEALSQLYEARAWADKLRAYAHEDGTPHPWERQP